MDKHKIAGNIELIIIAFNMVETRSMSKKKRKSTKKISSPKVILVVVVKDTTVDRDNEMLIKLKSSTKMGKCLMRSRVGRACR